MDDVVRAGEDSAQSPAGWIATAGNADADPKDTQGRGDDPGQTECSTATASALGGTSASDGGAVSREDRIVFRGCDVEVRNLEKSFGDRVLWSGLNFDLHPGDMAGLVGPSGCGKSTLLNRLGLLEAPRRAPSSWMAKSRRPTEGIPAGCFGGTGWDISSRITHRSTIPRRGRTSTSPSCPSLVATAGRRLRAHCGSWGSRGARTMSSVSCLAARDKGSPWQGFS